MKRTAWLVGLGVAVLAADQATKYLAVAHLTTALDGKAGLERLAAFARERNLDEPAEPGGEMRLKGSYRLIEDYWHFRYVENPGAAWGLFAGLPASVRSPLFYVIGVAAVGFIVTMYRRLGQGEVALRLALGLVLGGALGNLLDRLLRGYVIDFIDWHWRNQPGLRWPTFNVADSAISVGVALMLLDSFRSRRQASAAPSLPAGQSAPGEGLGGPGSTPG